MIYLLIVTLVWAFSFSLIGVYLKNIDPWFSVLVRTGLAFVVFLSLMKVARIRQQPPKRLLQLATIGAVQLGIMYGFYFHSFLYLTVPEVLLFTIMTPIYITLINDALVGQFNRFNFLSAGLAVVGAFAIRYYEISTGFVFGMLLVQGANLCFAIGQIAYKKLMSETQAGDSLNVFGVFYFGAFLVAMASFALFGDASRMPTTTTEWSVLIYLGVVASGVGYWAWNYGATQVSVGTLAAMNNLLIPAGILVNLVIWNREADLLRLSIGGGIILIAVLINQYKSDR